MTAFAFQDLANLRRWVISAAVVVLAHGGIAAATVTWREVIEPAEPAAAIVIDFAPVPVAPANLQTEIPPGPEQVMSDASPNKPVESREEKIEEKVEQKVEAKLEQKVEEKVESKPVEEPPPEIKPAPNPDVAIEPPPPPEVKQETPQRQEPRPPAPTTSAPQALPEESALIPAAPTPGPITSKNSQGVLKWKNQIVALLERNKRYPPAAQSRRQGPPAFRPAVQRIRGEGPSGVGSHGGHGSVQRRAVLPQGAESLLGAEEDQRPSCQE